VNWDPVASRPASLVICPQKKSH